MLYESFRNKTLNNSEDAHGDVVSSNVANDNGSYNDGNENGMQSRPALNGTDSNENRDSDVDEDDVVVDVESSINKNVDEEHQQQHQINGKHFGTRTDNIGTTNTSKAVRSGRPWMFGVHKNPKVVSRAELIGILKTT